MLRTRIRLTVKIVQGLCLYEAKSYPPSRDPIYMQVGFHFEGKGPVSISIAQSTAVSALIEPIRVFI